MLLGPHVLSNWRFQDSAELLVHPPGLPQGFHSIEVVERGVHQVLLATAVPQRGGRLSQQRWSLDPRRVGHRFQGRFHHQEGTLLAVACGPTVWPSEGLRQGGLTGGSGWSAKRPVHEAVCHRARPELVDGFAALLGSLVAPNSQS